MQEKDVVTIEYFEDHRRFADLINGFVFLGEQIVAPEDITELNRVLTKIWRKSGWLRAQMMIRDLARQVRIGVGAVMIAVENQSDVHYAMPIRIMSADSAAYDAQWKKRKRKNRLKRGLLNSEFLSGMKKDEKLTPCFTIVIYFGEVPWNGPRNLKDMLDLDTLPAQVQKLVADYPVNLLEVRRLKHLEYFKTDIQYVFGLLQNTGNSTKLKQYIDSHREQFENLEEDAYDVISMMSHSKELQLSKNSNRNENGGINMCKAIQDLIAEGVNQGIEQGLENGIALTKKVFRLHSHGLSVEEIAHKCNISAEKVKWILEDSVA